MKSICTCRAYRDEGRAQRWRSSPSRLLRYAPASLISCCGAGCAAPAQCTHEGDHRTMIQPNRISIECRHVRLSHERDGKPVLRDINLRIEPGEFFVLLGAPGSGKSSLLRIIAGLNRDFTGALLLDG